MLELADYIQLIGELPEPPPVLLETGDQRAVFRSTEKMYKGIALWLQTLLLGKPLSTETLERYAVYQPHAEYSSALFRLCTGVHPRCAIVQSFFESPLEAWYICELWRSREQVERSGLLGYVPYVIGKREWHDRSAWMRERLAALDFTAEDSPYQKIEEASLHLFPWSLITVISALIAKQDDDFNRDYYQPYWRSDRRFHDRIRRCKELQLVRIDKDGCVCVTGGPGRLKKLV